jgi:hypothetical protein
MNRSRANCQECSLFQRQRFIKRLQRLVNRAQQLKARGHLHFGEVDMLQ